MSWLVQVGTVLSLTLLSFLLSYEQSRVTANNMAEIISADYLVVGAGAVGLAFVDTLIKDTEKSVVIIDRYPRPGGHWTVAYSFVHLHQPAAFYGVDSRPLVEGTIDKVGFNKGLLQSASRDKVLSYFGEVMTQTLLPSGRVKYFPKHDYLGNGEFRSLINGKAYKVGPDTCIVDATYSKTSVPSMRPPPYKVDSDINFMPINGLPDIQTSYGNYTVVGAGKTGIDACLWLLEHGISASDITWIMPRDSFFVERETMQPGNGPFEAKTHARVQALIESIMGATSIDDLLHRQADAGVLIRLDPNVWPTMYHCATISLAEVEALRTIKNVIRQGRITHIFQDQVLLTKGSYTPVPNTLYIDCSATAIPQLKSVPVFEHNKITLQPVRFCQLTFSAALIAHIEASYTSTAKKNELCEPVPMPSTPSDSVLIEYISNINALRWLREPAIAQWVAQTRLNFFDRLLPPPPAEKVEAEKFMAYLFGALEAATNKMGDLWTQAQSGTDESVRVMNSCRL